MSKKNFKKTKEDTKQKMETLQKQKYLETSYKRGKGEQSDIKYC